MMRAVHSSPIITVNVCVVVTKDIMSISDICHDSDVFFFVSTYSMSLTGDCHTRKKGRQISRVRERVRVSPLCTMITTADEDVDMKDVDVKLEVNKENEQNSLTPQEQKEKEKQEWIKQMRLKFCIRPEYEITKNMIFPDGTLNQE